MEVTTSNIAAISISVVISGMYFTDLIFSRKSKGFFIRSLVFLVTSSGVGALIKDKWEVFSVCLISVLAIGVALSMVYHHLFMRSRKSKLSSSNAFDYLRFIWEGYPEFQRKLNIEIKAEERNRAAQSKTFSKLNEEVKEKIPEFINQIFCLAFESPHPAKHYCYAVMERFVTEFLSKNDARFTLREYDPATKTMKSIACTDDKLIPAPIPIKKKNMITLSAQRGVPVLYSRNKSWHCKGNGSLESGKFSDYATHCLLRSNNNVPYFSVCIDVKGEKSADRLAALFDSNILSIVFKAMEMKIINEAKQSHERRAAA